MTGAESIGCNACPSGSFSNVSGTSHCTSCEESQYTLSMGSVQCRDKFKLCLAPNYAKYGSCLASDFSVLQVQSPDSTQVYPGDEFTIRVLKKDIYNQTILSDSSSILELVSKSLFSGSTIQKFREGSATFRVSIKPEFILVSFIESKAIMKNQVSEFVIQGEDIEFSTVRFQSNKMMQSSTQNLTFNQGITVCPTGYSLLLDDTAFLNGTGICVKCEPGKYSINPLAPDPNTQSFSNLKPPSCASCPRGADCGKGGNIVIFNIGEWIVASGMLVLVSCPVGYSLVNSSDGTSQGDFWHDGQQCKPCGQFQYAVDFMSKCQDCPVGAICANRAECAFSNIESFKCANGNADDIIGEWKIVLDIFVLIKCPPGYALINSSDLTSRGTFNAGIQQCIRCRAGQYIIDSNDGLCRDCPKGAACPDGVHFLPIVNGSRYNIYEGAYVLESCPMGYELNSQSEQCTICPTSCYCPGEVFPNTPCPEGKFAAPGAATLSDCRAVVFLLVTMTFNCQRSTFSGVMESQTQNALATCFKARVGEVVVSSVAVASPSSTQVIFQIAFPDAHTAVSKNRSFKMGDLMNDLLIRDIPFASVDSLGTTGCLPGYELSASNCIPCTARWFCAGGSNAARPCPANFFSEPGSNSTNSCEKAIFVFVTYSFPVSLETFTVYYYKEASLKALASIAKVSVSRVMVESILPIQERRATQSVEIQFAISTSDARSAETVFYGISQAKINSALELQNIPPGNLVSVQISDPDIVSTGNTANTATIGFVIGVTIGFVLISFVVTLMVRKYHAYHWNRQLIKIYQNAKSGEKATSQYLPFLLRGKYVPELVLGKGAYGLVVKVHEPRTKHTLAIKIVVPEKAAFSTRALRQLNRESLILEMATSRNTECMVHLAGIQPVHIAEDLSWFILQYLNGDDLESVVKNGPEGFLSDSECIKMARSVLAALKVMHAEGLLHRDIKPANIMRSKADLPLKDSSQITEFCSYRLIDFGSSIGIDETLADKIMMTRSSQRNTGAGTPPYMSPEMYREPECVSFPSDLWSLGISMFEVLSGLLPFQATNQELWSLAIAGDMNEIAPNIMDYICNDKRAKFDFNLASVIAKVLQKTSSDRYQSADEMHEAVFACLVQKGNSFYSLFISYRVASEAPLASIIFDELNHTVTPGGHRVCVYWDAYRLVKGENWEAGFASGLLNSACIFPLLSYGSTAPLASLEPEKMIYGWDEFPVGRRRLRGSATDPEDNVLKELLIAQTILQAKQAGQTIGGILQLAYPILIGRQEPKGHKNYPNMGNFFHLNGGGGQYPDSPSIPTNKAVIAFFNDSKVSSLPEDLVESVEAKSVSSLVKFFTDLQGCQLYNQAGLIGLDLSQQQRSLLGKGFTGPAANLDSVVLTREQQELCKKGFDEEQLKMLKAQVRSKLNDFHEVIDRAVHAHNTAKRLQEAIGSTDTMISNNILQEDPQAPCLTEPTHTLQADLGFPMPLFGW